MPNFLFTARNPEGITITDRVEGATVAAARYKLETQGFSGISFHTDDMERHTEALVEDPELSPTDVLSPEQELEARRGGGAIRETWVAWKRHAIFWVPLAAWIGFSFAEGRPYSAWDWTGFGLSGAFVCISFGSPCPVWPIRNCWKPGFGIAGARCVAG